MQKPSVLIGLCILIATVGSVPLLAELDGDGEVELAAQVTVDEIDLVPTDAAPAAPRVALLFMNTQEGLGSALVTWGRLVRMAANSGAVLIDPFVSAGRIGNKHLPNAVTEGGERRGGMRLSTYFDYFPRAAAEESGACKFVIDYDAAHLDVLAVTPKLRLGELQKEAVFPRIPSATSRNGANWVFCDAKKYGIKAATMMYFRGKATSLPPRIEARYTICVFRRDFNRGNLDAKALWASIVKGVTARDLAEGHIREDGALISIGIGAPVAQFHWNFMRQPAAYPSTMTDACIPRVWNPSALVEAMARAFAAEHLADETHPLPASAPLDLKFWTNRPYASVQLRLFHMIANLEKGGRILLNLDLHTRETISTHGCNADCNPLAWTVDAANRALLDGIENDQDTFGRFATRTAAEDAPSQPKLRVYVASDLWSLHDGGGSVLRNQLNKRLPTSSPDFWRKPSEEKAREILVADILDEIAGDNFEAVRLNPDVDIAPLCEHDSITRDATLHAQCVAFVTEDLAGAHLMLDIVLVRNSRLSVVAGGGGLSRMMITEPSGNKWFDQPLYRDWKVSSHQETVPPHVVYRISCIGLHVSCSSGG